jgi:hypothetical protein
MDFESLFNENLQNSIYIFSILSFAIYSQDNLQTTLFPLITKKTNLNWFGNSIEIIKIKINILFNNLQLDCQVNDIDLIYDTYPDGNLCYVYKITFKQKLMYIFCFRGTETNKNWWTNFYSIYAKKISIGHNINVAKYFYTSFYQMNSKVNEYLKKNIHKKDNILLLGHSLGGVYANILAYNLLKKSYTNLHLFTINSPRVGDYNFAKFLNYSLYINYRLFTFPEIICTLPPKTILKYYHSGRGIYISFIDKFSINIQIKNVNSMDPYILDDSPNMFFSLFNSGNILKNINNLVELHGIRFLGSELKIALPSRNDIPFFKSSVILINEFKYNYKLFLNLIIIVSFLFLIYLLKR